MPKTADQKPRNKHRREKWQHERIEIRNRTEQSKRRDFLGPLRPARAVKAARRRFLQQDCQAIVRAQREFEAALVKAGIRWRAVETFVHKMADGQWARIDNAFIAKLFEAHGFKVEKAA